MQVFLTKKAKQIILWVIDKQTDQH